MFSCILLVLIESDWNLKFAVYFLLRLVQTVLIESDWNLKVPVQFESGLFQICINRIRLEFKAVLFWLPPGISAPY